MFNEGESSTIWHVLLKPLCHVFALYIQQKLFQFLLYSFNQFFKISAQIEKPCLVDSFIRGREILCTRYILHIMRYIIYKNLIASNVWSEFSL